MAQVQWHKNKGSKRRGSDPVCELAPVQAIFRVGFLINETLFLLNQMDFIQTGIQRISGELIQHRKYNYGQDSLDQFLDANPNFHCRHSTVKNKRGENISTMLLNRARSDTCLIYAHGLGSNKIQILSLVKEMKNVNYHFCSFDFSGSGRSDGEYTTFGLREQDDVNAIIGSLDVTRQYSRYILWGRSMGGAAIVLSQSRNLHPKVQCIILDSPFSSFQKAAVEIASKNSIFPQSMLTLLMGPVKEHMEKQHSSVNPFRIDICKAIANITARIMLIYSKDDSIVNYGHSKEIGKHCRRNPIQLEIKEDHNKPRKSETYSEALRFIRESFDHFDSKQKRSRSKGRGISVSSKENVHINSSVRKSICSSANSQKMSSKDSFSRRPNGGLAIGSFSSTEGYSPRNCESRGAIIKSVVLQRHEESSQQFHANIKMKTLKKYRGIFI